MKRFSFCMIFLVNCVAGISQSDIKTSGVSTLTSENYRWGLEQYVWSHAQCKVEKNSKPPIDYDAMSGWMQLSKGNDVQVSPNGKYFAYGIKKVYNNSQTLDTLVIQSTDGYWRQTFLNTISGFFSHNSGQYIFFNGYQSKLGIVDLGQRAVRYIDNLQANKSPSNGKNEWIAFQFKNPSTVVLYSLKNGEEKRFDDILNYDFDPSGQWLACEIKSSEDHVSKDMLFYNLTEKKELRFKDVTSYIFSALGNSAVLKTIRRSNGETVLCLQFVDLLKGSTQEFWTTSDTSHVILEKSLDATGKQLVFTLEQKGNKSIWFWKSGMNEARCIVTNQTKGLDQKLMIQGQANFTDNGHYVQFKIVSRSGLRKTTDANSIAVDVWSHQDTILQSTQSEVLKLSKHYTAIYSLDKGTLFQLETPYKKLLDYKVYGDYAVITQSGSSVYGGRFWEKEYYFDSCWVVSLQDGLVKYIGRASRSSEFSVSPRGDYLVFADCDKNYSYFSYNLGKGKLTNISAGVQANRFRGRGKIIKRSEKFAFGIAGWLEGDEAVFVYDNYDIWQLDLSGKAPAKIITNGYGEKHATEFSFMKSVRFSASQEIFHQNDTLVVIAFNDQNKQSGFYHIELGVEKNPELLYMGPNVFGGIEPVKATDDNAWIVQRESPIEAPNCYYTRDFKSFKCLTDIKPHKVYNWISKELCSFKQLDGSLGYGVLTKPENFNPKIRYPTIIAFYTRLTDQLNQFPTPKYLDDPSPFDNPAWFASNGYLVFTPDVSLTDGQWGPSTMNVVDAAARYLSKLSYVDGLHIAACGHSNSGTTAYYVLTHSHLFAAMSIGAGSADIISRALSLYVDKKSELEFHEVTAYLSGLGNIWKNMDSWLDHTSVLHANEVTSPLLMFHCEKDWNPVRQAVEMFISLQRLEKKVWWLQYDKGGHVVASPILGGDFTLRTTQFYDHYLKGAPASGWMTKGIPNSVKGIELRYELDPNGKCGKDCIICKAWNEQYKRNPQMFKTALTGWRLDQDLKDSLEKEEKRRFAINQAKDDKKIKDVVDKLAIKKR